MLDHIGGVVAMLLVAMIMVLQGWPLIESRGRLPTTAGAVVLASVAGTYVYRALWPVDLSLAERLERIRSRAESARPLPGWALLVIAAVIVAAVATRSLGLFLVVGGTGMAGVYLAMLARMAQLRRRRGPGVWSELADAQELSASLLAAKSGRAYRGRFLP